VALAKLADLKREAGLHTAALRLEMRALTATGQHADVLPLVDQLVKRKVYDAAQGELVCVSAYAQALTALRGDASGLRSYWKRLSETDRTNSKVALAGAKGFLSLGGDREAAEIIVRSLDDAWDSRLVPLYAQCRTPDARRQLEIAERWLLTHNQDAQLLYVLGRLCERERLWGKAQTYYEASLALANDWRTHVALGEMLGQLGRVAEANDHLSAAFKLAIAELESAAA
jgi:HemY protein